MTYLPQINNRIDGLTLSLEELVHFAQNCFLPEIGISGQKKLKAAVVGVVGAGGLGCPVLQGFASAGVGRIRIIDGDRVERGNLARQFLYSYDDIGQFKARAAANTLKRQNPFVAIDAVTDDLTSENSEAILGGCDLVIDATDRSSVRQWIDQCGLKLRIPWIHGGMYRNEGRIALFHPYYGLRYEDLFGLEIDSSSCGEEGVLGPVCSILGNVQVLEAIKLITGYAQPLWGDWITLKTQSLKWNRWKWKEVSLPPIISSPKETSKNALDWESFQLGLWTRDKKILIHLGKRPEFTILGDATTEKEMTFESILSERSMLTEYAAVFLTCDKGIMSQLLAEAIHTELGKPAYSLKDGVRGNSEVVETTIRSVSDLVVARKDY